MTACSQSTPLYPKVPSNLLVNCSDLDFINGNTGKDILLWAKNTVITYEDCKSKQKALSDMVKSISEEGEDKKGR